jgi:hypothetical protein
VKKRASKAPEASGISPPFPSSIAMLTVSRRSASVNQYGTPMSLRAWALPVSSTTPRSA